MLTAHGRGLVILDRGPKFLSARPPELRLRAANGLKEVSIAAPNLREVIALLI
jgi:hypothetical protein